MCRCRKKTLTVIHGYSRAWICKFRAAPDYIIKHEIEVQTYL